MVAINSDAVDLPSANFAIQGSDISAPGASRAQIYVKSNGVWYILNGGTATRLMDNPLTTAGDMLVSGASGAPTRLAKGNDNDSLMMDSSTHLPVWAYTAPLNRAATYNTATAQSIPNNAATVVNFDTLVSDPNSLVTVGAGWYFAAPATGRYHVDAGIQLAGNAGWAAGEAAYLAAYVNGTGGPYVYWASPVTLAQSVGMHLSCEVGATSGQHIAVRLFQNSGGAIALNGDAGLNFVTIRQVA